MSELFQLIAIAVDLQLLLVLFFVLAHELVTDQSAADEPDRSSDQRAYRRMADCTTDDRSRARAQAPADEPALFAFAERL